MECEEGEILNTEAGELPAEGLSSLFDKIYRRIEDHRALYEQNEMAVLTQLVDPILRELGWDPADPDSVVPNLSADEGFSGYVLLSEGKPALCVEAKNLHHDLAAEKWVSHLLTHAFGEGTSYGLLTNGAIWILAASFKAGTRPVERIIWKVDLQNDTRQAVVRKVNMLMPSAIITLDTVVEKVQIMDEVWASLISDPTYFVLGVTPIVTELLKQSYPIAVFSSEEIESFLVEQFDEMLARVAETLTTDRATEPLAPPNGRQSLSRMVLYGDEYPIRKAYDILVNTANWLVKQGRLTKGEVPIKAGPKRFLVNTQKVHVYGNSFMTPKELSNGLWMEVHYSRADCIRHAQNLLTRYHYDPKKLMIQ